LFMQSIDSMHLISGLWCFIPVKVLIIGQLIFKVFIIKGLYEVKAKAPPEAGPFCSL
jgi:hypothetical protein